jgi:DNA-binding winged helix-turn-helix (wHTH) protein
MNAQPERAFVTVPRQVPSPADPDTFAVGDWLIEPSLCRVTRTGTTLRIRPQLMDVLVCLATRPGRCVSRHEMLSTVWSGRFVAESGLARCIAELRQVLGDDARHPRIIETITKRGYRLMGVSDAPSSDHGAGAESKPRPMPVAVMPVTGLDGQAESRGMGEWLRSAVSTCRRWRPWLSGGGVSS